MSVSSKRFAYLLCWPRERGIRLACTRIFSFHEFYNFLLFNFLILIFLLEIFFTHDTSTHTHTHDPRPPPTTVDPRHLATLVHEEIQSANYELGILGMFSLLPNDAFFCLCLFPIYILPLLRNLTQFNIFFPNLLANWYYKRHWKKLLIA